MDQALCVLAGRMPAHLKVKMGEKVYLAKTAVRNDPEVAENVGLQAERLTAAKSEALREAVEEWQTFWDAFDPSNWTRRLVPSVQTFLSGAGVVFQTDYWLSQLLTSHGAFNAFKANIGKAQVASCDDCGGTMVDDAEHVLTSCSTYDEERRTLAQALGAPVEALSIVGLATRTPEDWAALKAFAFKTMKDRATKEQAKEAAAKRLEARRKRGKRKGRNSRPPSDHAPKKWRTLPPPTPLDTG